MTPVQDQYTILRLINQVKRHSCIWDDSDSNYRNSVARTEAWNAIAKQTGIFVPILIRKWRSLTCSYRRIKAELIKKQAQHPGKGLKSSWFAYNAMEFLENMQRGHRKRGTLKYLLAGTADHSSASNDSQLDDFIDQEEHLEEMEEIFEIEPEAQSPATDIECNELDAELNDNSPATCWLQPQPDNGDEYQEDIESSFEKRYLNEQRKSVLLYELNEKLEKDLAEQKAKIEVQRLKIERLEQKLKDTEQKLASFTEKRQEDDDEITSTGGAYPKTAEVSGLLGCSESVTVPATLSVLSSPNRCVEEQSDPLSSALGPNQLSGTVYTGRSMKVSQLITNSLKRLQTSVQQLANKNTRRYSGFGDFMVSELNEMDEATSLRLINEMTSLLKTASDGVVRNNKDVNE
ncbi:liprin-alpha-2-like isoform X2 [Anopheles merus]|uniref:liprin-alpha-2-like isoform X2 n=1 Tax=Anopheles merus TaxID=30066 RepID=UPI001BE4CC4D|nr:liprin-alpha-2-like isoform X2 [Anopheles merus]